VTTYVWINQSCEGLLLLPPLLLLLTQESDIMLRLPPKSTAPTTRRGIGDANGAGLGEQSSLVTLCKVQAPRRVGEQSESDPQCTLPRNARYSYATCQRIARTL
jgi:hypothetical protein